MESLFRGYCYPNLYILEHFMESFCQFYNLVFSFNHLILKQRILFIALISQILDNLCQFQSLFYLKIILYLLINRHHCHFQNIYWHFLKYQIKYLQ